MITALDRWSLQYRITASVGVGLGLILLLFGYVNMWSISQATDAALEERGRLALVLAEHMDTLLAGAPAAEVPAAANRLLRGSAGPADGRLQVEVLDGTGAVVASTPASWRRGSPDGATPQAAANAVVAPGSHAALLADLIAARKPGVRPHRAPPGAQWPAHIVAYAPLHLGTGNEGWGLTVEQPQDVVLSLPHRLRDRMLIFGAAALVVASVLAWLDVRQVVAPLRRVTAAAQRIAAGDLAVPLADGGGRRRDEVGRLTVALDTMRGRLVRSLAEINEGNLQLERRVRQRTEELAAITAQHRQLLNKVIWAQEEERKRLARELHDDTLQTLSGVAMSLQAIEDGLPPHLARERERLAWAKSQAVHAAREIRQLMLDLRPSVLDDLGLVPAVRWYVTTHLEPFGVHARIDAPDTLPPLPSTVQTVAFRVLQEAVANVAKHAHASRADICIEVADHCLRAGVADDGRGFDPSALRAARREAADERLSATSVGAGLGLLGMEERVGLMGGQLEVESQPGAGTRVRFTIPLPSNDAPEPDSDVVEPLLLDRAPVGAALGGLP